MEGLVLAEYAVRVVEETWSLVVWKMSTWSEFQPCQLAAESVRKGLAHISRSGQRTLDLNRKTKGPDDLTTDRRPFNFTLTLGLCVDKRSSQVMKPDFERFFSTMLAQILRPRQSGS